MINSKAIRMNAIEYSKKFKASERLVIILRPFICPFSQMLRCIPCDQNVLDIGCGNGFWLYLLDLYTRAKSLSGVDASDQKIKAARNALMALNSSTTLLTAADPALWPVGQYGVVSMIDVMHHIPPDKQEMFFCAAADKVAKGGILIYKDMCIRPRWKSFANIAHDLIFARQWVNHVDILNIESLALNAGLSLEKKIDLTTLWYGHELRSFSRPV